MSMILHHYPLSPYSEKIRAMCAYAEQDWVSCLTSEAPPRGKLDLLTGGYNRIPVAQWGADIICDSNLIADELATLSKDPALANEALDSQDLALRQHMESKLFFACVNRAVSLPLLGRIAKEKGMVAFLHFVKDRIQMSTKASINMGSPKSAPRYINQGMNEVAKAMGEHRFMGGDLPCLLDFAAYHCFWFLQEVGERDDLAQQQKVAEWYQRMSAFKSVPKKELSIEEALIEAKNTEPRPIPQRYLNDHRIGSQIVVAPSDYRQVPVSGVLVGADTQRWIIRRESNETGPLHLHFPTHAVDVTIRIAN